MSVNILQKYDFTIRLITSKSAAIVTRSQVLTQPIFAAYRTKSSLIVLPCTVKIYQSIKPFLYDLYIIYIFEMHQLYTYNMFSIIYASGKIFNTKHIIMSFLKRAILENFHRVRLNPLHLKDNYVNDHNPKRAIRPNGT